MITQKPIFRNEIKTLLDKVDTSKLDLYTIFYEENLVVGEIDKEICPVTIYIKYPNGETYNLFYSHSVNKRYFKKPIHKQYFEDTSIDLIIDAIESTGVSIWRFMIGNSKTIYEYNEGKLYEDDEIPTGSFVYLINPAHDGKYKFFINDGKKWQEFINSSDLTNHAKDYTNPHHVDKTDIGLDKVINVEQACKNDFVDHINDFKNPHKVNKHSVGLGNVTSGKQVNKSLLNSHIENIENPHEITKEDVGLGNVLNMEQVSVTELEDHIDYEYAHGIVKNNIRPKDSQDDPIWENGLGAVQNELQATKVEFDKHVDDRLAHNITKLQVGLGNVLNEMQVSEIEFSDHAKKIYGNPHSVTKITISLGNVINEQQCSFQKFDLHVKNINNPHNVTKEDVGLGNVTNDDQVDLIDFNTHINDIDNPHRVTKEEIGLGNVLNEVSVTNEVFNSHVNLKSNTGSKLDPHGITIADLFKHFIPSKDRYLYKDWNIHADNRSNPHNVTKELIGLEKVKNIKQATYRDYSFHVVTPNSHGLTPFHIGLGNIMEVNNDGNPYSDVDMPVSSALTNAINAKLKLSYQADVSGVKRNDQFLSRYVDSLAPAGRLLINLNYLYNFVGFHLGIYKDNTFNKMSTMVKRFGWNPTSISANPSDYLSMFFTWGHNNSTPDEILKNDAAYNKIKPKISGNQSIMIKPQYGDFIINCKDDYIVWSNSIKILSETNNILIKKQSDKKYGKYGSISGIVNATRSIAIKDKEEINFKGLWKFNKSYGDAKEEFDRLGYVTIKDLSGNEMDIRIMSDIISTTSTNVEKNKFFNAFRGSHVHFETNLKIYGIIPTMNRCYNTFIFETGKINTDSVLLDARSQCGVPTHACLLHSNGTIAYNARNSAGLTYIDGRLNTTIKCPELNYKHTALLFNSTISSSNTISPLIGKSCSDNNYATVDVYKFAMIEMQPLSVDLVYKIHSFIKNF